MNNIHDIHCHCGTCWEARNGIGISRKNRDLQYKESRRLAKLSWVLGCTFIMLFNLGYFLHEGSLPDYVRLQSIPILLLGVTVLTAIFSAWALAESKKTISALISGLISLSSSLLLFGSDRDTSAFIFFLPIPYAVTGSLSGLVAAFCSRKPREWFDRLWIGLGSGLAVYVGLMSGMFVVNYLFG